jgi:hypothetical protein
MSKMRLEDNESWDKRVRPTSRDAREQMENREVLRRLIAAQLSYYNIPTRALPDSDSVCGYEQWTVNDEETIYEEDGGDFCKLVSRFSLYTHGRL